MLSALEGLKGCMHLSKLVVSSAISFHKYKLKQAMAGWGKFCEILS